MFVKRLAVIIVGEYRTWDICAKYFFNRFESRASQIDYFFVTWDKSLDLTNPSTPVYRTVTDEDVTKHFAEHQLVNYKIVPADDYENTHTYYIKAYLSKIANILKREKELADDFVYDQVIETRPDIYFHPMSEPGPLSALKNFEVVGGVKDATLALCNQGFLTVGDVYQRSTSLTHDLIANRILDSTADVNRQFLTNLKGHSTHHWLFARHLLSHGIIFHDSADFLNLVPVRFNVDPAWNLDQIPYEQLWRLFLDGGPVK